MNTQVTFTDTILLPGILCVIGVFVHILRLNKARLDHQRASGAWIGYLFVGLALCIAINDFWAIVNPQTGQFFRATIFSKKTLITYYVLFPIVLGLVISMFLVERSLNRRLDAQE